MGESKRRKPFAREDVAANIATCRACWTPGTQATMSEDATSGQLERRGNRHKVAKRLESRRDEGEQTSYAVSSSPPGSPSVRQASPHPVRAFSLTMPETQSGKSLIGRGVARCR